MRDVVKRWLKDFVHNSIVHPLMPFLPVGFGSRLHDDNASWAFGDVDAEDEGDEDTLR